MKPSGYGRVGIALLTLLGGLAQAQPSGDSLYMRIGGEARMRAIVQEFAGSVWVEPALAPFYKGVTRSKFEKHLQQQFCSLSGGQCVYEGEGMREVHAGLKIGQAEFYRLVEVLRETLQHQNVPLRERNELLAMLAPMKRDVVEPRK